METTEGFAVSTMSAISGRDLTAAEVSFCIFTAVTELDSGKETTEVSEVVS